MMALAVACVPVPPHATSPKLRVPGAAVKLGFVPVPESDKFPGNAPQSGTT